MMQLTLDHDARHCLPPEVQIWWDEWRSRKPTAPETIWVDFVVDVLRSVR